MIKKIAVLSFFLPLCVSAHGAWGCDFEEILASMSGGKADPEIVAAIEAVQPAPPEEKWVDGDYFSSIRRDGVALGLIPDFSVLKGPDFDPTSVNPKIARFYENTSFYRLRVSARKSIFALPFVRPVVNCFGRSGNLRIPTKRKAETLRSTLENVAFGQKNEVSARAWVRRHPDGKLALSGLYSVTEYRGVHFVTVVFPFRIGNLTSVLHPRAESGGGLVLANTGEEPFSGEYFTYNDQASPEYAGKTVKLKHLSEKFSLYENPDGGLSVHHDLFLYGIRGIRLDYDLSREAARAE